MARRSWSPSFVLAIFTGSIWPNSRSKFQFWNLLVVRISKLNLLLIFVKVEPEIIEDKDTRGHFHYSHFLVVLVNLLTNFNKEFSKINFLNYLFVKAGSFVWKISQKDVKLSFESPEEYLYKLEKNFHIHMKKKWPLVSLTSIIPASTLPNIKCKEDSLEILKTSRFWNWSYFLVNI